MSLNECRMLAGKGIDGDELRIGGKVEIQPPGGRELGDDADIGDGRLAPKRVGPALDLLLDGGGSLRLSSLLGKPVVLYFYPQDDTTSCTAEAIGFSQLRPDFEKAGTAVIGLSPDSTKKHDKFKAKHGLSIDLVADEERKVIEAYGLWVEKQMYGRRYMGVERATFLIGADGRIVRAWRKVRVKGHAEAVLEAVRQLRG